MGFTLITEGFIHRRHSFLVTSDNKVKLTPQAVSIRSTQIGLEINRLLLIVEIDLCQIVLKRDLVYNQFCQ